MGNISNQGKFRMINVSEVDEENLEKKDFNTSKVVKGLIFV